MKCHGSSSARSASRRVGAARLVGGAELLVALRGGVERLRRGRGVGRLDGLLVLAGFEQSPDLGRVLREGDRREEQERECDCFHKLTC